MYGILIHYIARIMQTDCEVCVSFFNISNYIQIIYDIFLTKYFHFL